MQTPKPAALTPYDIAVIGGGVNGCGIARDAAGRGAKVLLLEASDLASGTSSASTKLIHGGLRYLEHFEFALVRESLSERERLWAIAPHIIWPMRFVLPHVSGLRPRWLLRAGLFLYDHIGGRKRLAPTKSIKLQQHSAGKALKPQFRNAFTYSDCWVDDARLVVLNARDAADRGTDVRTRCKVEKLIRKDDIWEISTTAGIFSARTIVNAAGPSVMDLLDRSEASSSGRIRLVRGSHIVVPRMFDHDLAYFFQLPDGRIFFAIPYERDFTLVGTTDCDHDPDIDPLRASEEEIAYLCEGVNFYFRKAISPDDVVWTFSGVRPLFDDGSNKPEAATRGYRFELTPESEGAPMLSIFGGKITTYRHLAQEAVDLLAPHVSSLAARHWTDKAALPGGDFPIEGSPALLDEVVRQYPFLDRSWADRMVRSYGTLTNSILGDAKTLADCGHHFGYGLTEREVRYLVEREWSQSAEDILWRRSKLGLRFTTEQAAALDDFLQRGQAARSPSSDADVDA